VIQRRREHAGILPQPGELGDTNGLQPPAPAKAVGREPLVVVRAVSCVAASAWWTDCDSTRGESKSGSTNRLTP